MQVATASLTAPPAGIHMVWTHVHLIACALLWSTGCVEAMAVCAAVGVQINVAWYALLVVYGYRLTLNPNPHPFAVCAGDSAAALHC